MFAMRKSDCNEHKSQTAEEQMDKLNQVSFAGTIWKKARLIATDRDGGPLMFCSDRIYKYATERRWL